MGIPPESTNQTPPYRSNSFIEMQHFLKCLYYSILWSLSYLLHEWNYCAFIHNLIYWLDICYLGMGICVHLPYICSKLLTLTPTWSNSRRKSNSSPSCFDALIIFNPLTAFYGYLTRFEFLTCLVWILNCWSFKLLCWMIKIIILPLCIVFC